MKLSAFVKDRETKELTVIERDDYSTKAAFTADLKANGYIVKRISNKRDLAAQDHGFESFAAMKKLSSMYIENPTLWAKELKQLAEIAAIELEEAAPVKEDEKKDQAAALEKMIYFGQAVYNNLIPADAGLYDTYTAEQLKEMIDQGQASIKEIARNLQLLKGKKAPYNKPARRIAPGTRLARGTSNSHIEFVQVLAVGETEKMMKFVVVTDKGEIETVRKNKSSYLVYI